MGAVAIDSDIAVRQMDDKPLSVNVGLVVDECAGASVSPIMARRIELMHARMRGEKPRDYEICLAEKYGVTPEAIKFDWYRRSKWMPEVVDAIDAKSIVAECDATNAQVLTQLRETVADLRNEIDRRRDDGGYLDMNDPHTAMLLSFQAQYLKALLDSNTTSLKTYQSLGLVTERPREILKKTISIDLTKALGNLDAETRAEVQSRLLEIYETELEAEDGRRNGEK